MKHTLTHQAKRTGIALGAVAALAALGTGAAQAASFASTTLILDRFGNLECNFREVGLTPGSEVRYDCTSMHVGVLQQCVLKNKAVGNSKLLVFHDISAHEVENLPVGRNGQIRATLLTQIPQSESNSLLCTAPSELTTTAVRWCNNSLVDLTNNIVGGTVPELFVHLISNASGSVPSCAVLATLPGVTPGE